MAAEKIRPSPAGKSLSTFPRWLARIAATASWSGARPSPTYPALSTTEARPLPHWSSLATDNSMFLPRHRPRGIWPHWIWRVKAFWCQPIGHDQGEITHFSDGVHKQNIMSHHKHCHSNRWRPLTEPSLDSHNQFTYSLLVPFVSIL